MLGKYTIEKKEKLNDFLLTLPYDESIKKEVINFFLEEKPDDYYLVYPYFFYSFFFRETQQAEQINKVCIAGFLMYKHICISDAVYDDEHEKDSLKEKSWNFFISQLFHEESIKILSSLFPMDSKFWFFFNQRRFELFSSVKIEQAYKTKATDLTWKQYEKLSENKSAFAKVAIDIWYFLSKEKYKEEYQMLLQSQNYFSIGFQILDDIVDFERDLIHEQLNIGLVLLKKEMLKRGESYENMSYENLHKRFYIYEIVEDLIDKAEAYFDKSIAVLKDSITLLPFWLALIKLKKKEIQLLRLNIDAYYNKLIAQRYLSKQKKQTHTNEPLAMAVDFIVQGVGKDNLYIDFWNNAGMSNIWTTSFVLYNLSSYLQSHHKKKLFTDTAQQLNQLRQGKKNLWGYNSQWISDADSTSSALIALLDYDIELKGEFETWLSYQNQDGGFSTYLKDEEFYKSINLGVSDVQGWVNSHVCVSALAFYLFCHAPKSYLQSNQKAFDAIRNYILNQQLEHGLWSSYWWDSLVYASSFSLRALHKNGESQTQSFKKGVAGLANLLEEKNCIYNSAKEESSFFTALALSVFCLDQDIYQRWKTAADKCYQYLISNQYEDGSFPSSYIMRIPAPNVVKSSGLSSWTKHHQGTGIILNDFMRIFSTSASINAIWSYQKICG
ncbi:MAG: hypothetical protein AB8G15_03995 [Saprospiraceae bacterium]